MTSSNPNYVFPDCPDCGRPVQTTDLDQGGEYEPLGGADPAVGRFRARASQVAGVVGLAPRPVAGAPDLDRLTLHPCGHHLDGDAAAAYNLQAVNLTFPNFAVRIVVVVPASVTGRAEPTLYDVRTTAGYDELVTEAAAADVDPMADRIRRLAEQAITALPDLRPCCPPWFHAGEPAPTVGADR